MTNLQHFWQWLESNPVNKQGLDWQQFAGETEKEMPPGILINNGDYLLTAQGNDWMLIKTDLEGGKGDTDETAIYEVIKQYRERERERNQ